MVVITQTKKHISEGPLGKSWFREVKPSWAVEMNVLWDCCVLHSITSDGLHPEQLLQFIWKTFPLQNRLLKPKKKGEPGSEWRKRTKAKCRIQWLAFTPGESWKLWEGDSDPSASMKQPSKLAWLFFTICVWSMDGFLGSIRMDATTVGLVICGYDHAIKIVSVICSSEQTEN